MASQSTASPSPIQKKIQEKSTQSTLTNPGDDWGAFFASLGWSLFTFLIFTILGVNIGYIMKRQAVGSEGHLPTNEAAVPYGSAPLSATSAETEDDTTAAAKELLGGSKKTATATMKQRGGSVGGGSNSPLSVAYLGATSGQLQQSWVYKEAKNPGSLQWIIWEWFRNSAKFSWINTRGALKSVMSTLNYSMNETGVLTTAYVLMILWPLAAIAAFAVLAVPYLVSLGGVLMTTFTKWTTFWQLAVNLLLTFVAQGISFVPPLYSLGEILALVRYLVMPITHTISVGGAQHNYFWHQLKNNYMIVWMFAFLSICISAVGSLSTTSSAVICGVSFMIYLIMFIQSRVAK